MNNIAALPQRERNELFEITAEQMGISTIGIVEKDFWVCWTLKQVFEHPLLSKQLIFKGGTSLSKVYGLIDRFSEDIDLVLDWRMLTGEVDPLGERSKSKQIKLNSELNQKTGTYIASTLLPILENILGSFCEVDIQDGGNQTELIVRVEYPKTLASNFILPYIQLEIGPLASWLPHADRYITPYAAEKFPGMFKEPKCIVRSIDAVRTFWEKATILHQEANRPVGSLVPARYSRHYYDLCLMALNRKLRMQVVRSVDQLDNVIQFKKRFYPRSWANYDSAKQGTLKLIPPSHVLEPMEKDYQAMSDLIFGKKPSFEEIIAVLRELELEINQL